MKTGVVQYDKMCCQKLQSMPGFLRTGPNEAKTNSSEPDIYIQGTVASVYALLLRYRDASHPPPLYGTPRINPYRPDVSDFGSCLLTCCSWTYANVYSGHERAHTSILRLALAIALTFAAYFTVQPPIGSPMGFPGPTRRPLL